MRRNRKKEGATGQCQKMVRLEAETQGKEFSKNVQMWNFIAIGPLSKLTIPLTVPKFKDHF